MYAGAEGKKIILTGQTLLYKMTGIKRVAINPGQCLLKNYWSWPPQPALNAAGKWGLLHL